MGSTVLWEILLEGYLPSVLFALSNKSVSLASYYDISKEINKRKNGQTIIFPYSTENIHIHGLLYLMYVLQKENGVQLRVVIYDVKDTKNPVYLAHMNYNLIRSTPLPSAVDTKQQESLESGGYK